LAGSSSIVYCVEAPGTVAHLRGSGGTRFHTSLTALGVGTAVHFAQ